MPRPKLIRTDQAAYHVTARSNNQEWFYVPRDIAWTYFASLLWRVNEMYGAMTHAFVLMDNHFHWMLTTPNCNLDRITRYFLTEIGRSIRNQSGRLNHVFGNRYRWTLLPDAEANAFCFRYIAKNPVRAGMSLDVESYEFSTFNPLTVSRFPMGLTEGIGPNWSLIPNDPSKRSHWLNTPMPREREALIGKALRHYEFKLKGRGREAREIDLLRQEILTATDGMTKSN